MLYSSQFLQESGKPVASHDLWVAYCAFHLGDYQRAMQEYEKLLKQKKCAQDVFTYLACTYFMLGLYEKSEKACGRGPKSALQTRLLFHLSHKFGKEEELFAHHQNLKSCLEDELTLGSIHYMRQHYQEAIEIYKRLLIENKEFLAANFYVALCYFRLDFHDVSQQVLVNYLREYPDSAVAVNLKCCNLYRLYSGSEAEKNLMALMNNTNFQSHYAKDILKHNLTVFRGGEGALQHWSRLIDVIPEAKLNLAIYHLKNGNLAEASKVMLNEEPREPDGYILKAILHTELGQDSENFRGSKVSSREKEVYDNLPKFSQADHLKKATEFYQLVGQSGSECDTCKGRLCMASAFFLERNFSKVLLYLTTVKSFYYNDDTFNFNYGQARAARGEYRDAEEVLVLINKESIKNDPIYQSWLCRCFIMNGKPQKAWEMYLKMDQSNQSLTILHIIANDCYRTGRFYYSAKAFDTLERLDSDPTFWEGKRGACVGVFQQVIAEKEEKACLIECLNMLLARVHTLDKESARSIYEIKVLVEQWFACHTPREVRDQLNSQVLLSPPPNMVAAMNQMRNAPQPRPRARMRNGPGDMGCRQRGDSDDDEEDEDDDNEIDFDDDEDEIYFEDSNPRRY